MSAGEAPTADGEVRIVRGLPSRVNIYIFPTHAFSFRSSLRRVSPRNAFSRYPPNPFSRRRGVALRAVRRSRATVFGMFQAKVRSKRCVSFCSLRSYEVLILDTKSRCSSIQASFPADSPTSWESKNDGARYEGSRKSY